MADITAEQVARAIEAARSDEGGISDALGGWQWDKRAPDYVRVAWGKPSLPDFIAALTRWHAELVAAETPRKAPDDTAPERLRERREALGKDDGWIEHILDGLDVGVGAHKGDGGNGRNRRMVAEGDPDGCDSSYDSDEMEEIRAAYAAALSAAEAERPDKPDHLAYADSPVWDDGPLPTPTPERPAPRFKVGDWARDRDTVFRVAEMHWDDDRWYARPVAGVRDGIAEYSLQPASPPAPEVVDVPQPIVKRCACPDVHDDVEAEWRPGEPYLTVTHTTVPLALLRAMIEAIDAQHPTRDRMPPGEPKLLDPGKPGSEVFGG